MMRSVLILVMAVVPALAQIDLSGEWNPVFHEDQPERIPGPEIGDYLVDIRPLLDVDGNGQVDALTDGLLVLRYMFGFRGASLIADALRTGAFPGTAAAIQSQIQSLCP